MGLLPNGYLRLTRARRSLERWEAVLEKKEDPFVFLRYVGLGFWLGFQYPRLASRMDTLASSLRGSRYRHLVHDGYGFKVGFFDLHGQEPARGSESLESLRNLPGFARASAFNGLGRSVWFFTMDAPEEGFALARSMDPDGESVVSGMGLASAFTFVDDLSRPYRVAQSLEGGERRHFLKGIRIALYVRAMTDHQYLQKCLERLPQDLRTRAGEDLEWAARVGAETKAREDFIEAFHRGCL